MARNADLRPIQLAVAGTTGELQVALEHLWHPGQPSIAERASTGGNGNPLEIAVWFRVL